MKNKLLITLIIPLISLCGMHGMAQGAFLKNFSGTYSADLMVLRDDGQPIIAFTIPSGSCLKATDTLGNILWTANYTDFPDGFPAALFLNADLSITYFTRTYLNTLEMHKLSEAGEPEWDLSFTADDLGTDLLDSISDEDAGNIVQNADGSFSILNHGYATCGGELFGCYFAKISAEGEVLSTNSTCLGDFGMGTDYNEMGQEFYGDGTGYMQIDNINVSPSTRVLHLMELDASGSETGEYYYEGFNANATLKLSDGYLVGGWYQDPLAPGFYHIGGYYLMKTDLTGDSLWTKKFPSAVYTTPIDLALTDAGNYLGVFTTDSYIDENNFMQLHAPDGSIISTGDIFNPDGVMSYKDMQYISDVKLAFIGANGYSGLGFPNGALIMADGYGDYPLVELKGQVYYDANDNGTLDAAEPLKQDDKITMAPPISYKYSAADGAYSFFSLTGDPVSLSLSTEDYLLQSTPSGGAPIEVTPDLGEGYDIIDDLNFGVQFYSPGLNVVTDIAESWVTTTFDSYCDFVITNQGSEAIPSGSVTLSFSHYLTPSGSYPEYTSVDDTTVTFDFTDLGLFESRSFEVLFYPSEEIPLDLPVSFTSIISPTEGDIHPGNNYDTLHTVTHASYDPNHITVSPLGEGPEGIIDPLTQGLDYTIHFQNTGTDNTHFIVVMDTLDLSLIPASIGNIESGATYSMQFMEPNIIKWIFADLALTPASTDELHSTGFVKYHINLMEGLTPGAIIRNSAAIYFDYNPAILTNKTINTLKLPDAIATVPDAEQGIHMFPNPANTGLYISLVKPSESDMCYALSDITGREICNGTISANATETFIGTAQFPAGIYNCTIRDDNGISISTQKIVIIH